MSRQIFRLFATAPSLTEQERREVADEVARLRTLLTHVPGKARVRITANPTGPLGEYVALLMDAHARGVGGGGGGGAAPGGARPPPRGAGSPPAWRCWTRSPGNFGGTVHDGDG